MTARLRLLLVVVGIALASWPGAASADTSTARPSTEAWYRKCPLPAGCETVPLTPEYPAGTLHVGVSSGSETDRTYVEFDLSDIPSDASLEGGTLVVPLAGSADGTSAPESAELQACLVTVAVEEANGSYASPPETDCSVSTLARVADNTVRLDLGPLARRWTAGSRAALALVPSPRSIDNGASWHLAISSAKRGSGTPMSASVAYEVPAAAPAPDPDVRPAAGPSLLTADGATTDATLPLAADPPAGLPEADAPEVALPPRTGGSGASPIPSVATTTGFAYPAVWLLPLALLIVGGLLGRSLTRPIVVR